MRNAFVPLATASALIAVAACNGDQASEPPPSNQGSVTGAGAKSGGAATDPEAIMKTRHENYERMGDAMKAIGAQLKADSPSVPIIQRNAALIAGYGPQLLSWFPEGTARGPGRRTRAKAEIWTDAQTFRQRAQAFEAESARFNQAAQSGDLAAIRAGQAALGKSCKDCHDRFRAPEH
jgi:cytochrome c556